MATAIFRVTNPNNELVFSDSGITYGYIGRASLVSVSQASGNTVAKTQGLSQYTIDWPGDILVALPVKANGSTSLIATAQSGNTWTISVHKGNGSFDADGFDIEESTQVYVFGAPVGPRSGFGAWIYNPAGTMVADLSKIPLTWRGRLMMAANVTTWAMPAALSVPAVIGWPLDRNVTSAVSAPSYINRYQARGWRLSDSTTISRELYQNIWLREDGGDTATDLIRRVDAILIDASNLP